MTTDEIWNYLGDPICVVTKYYQDRPEQRGIFSPAITLNVTQKSELEDLGYETFEELIGMSHYGTSQILTDFRVTKEYDPYLICGCMFYEFDAKYKFEHVDIEKPLQIALKVLKAEHNGFYYDFNCLQSIAKNQIADLKFDNFKQTIKLI